MPAPKANDEGHVIMHVGSFKVLPQGTAMPSGKVDLAFTGTVLLTKLAPGSYVKTFGKVRREYSNEKYGKQVFFGSGRILVVGQFENFQCFGRKLNLTYKGFGFIRLFTEFDSNLQTGQIWFDPNEKDELPGSMITLQIPKVNFGKRPAVTREEFEKNKKKGGG